MGKTNAKGEMGVAHLYTWDEVDWIGVYDATTDRCIDIPSVLWDGQLAVSLRLVPTINGQSKGIRFARDFQSLIGDPRIHRSSGSASPLPLPLDLPPE